MLETQLHFFNHCTYTITRLLNRALLLLLLCTTSCQYQPKHAMKKHGPSEKKHELSDHEKTRRFFLFASPQEHRTLFDNAIDANHISIIENYISYPRFIPLKDYSLETMPMVRASALGRTEIVKLLLNSGFFYDHNKVPYQTQENEQIKALEVACQHNHMEIVQVFINRIPKTMSIFCIDHIRNSKALSIATSCHHIEMVKLLLSCSRSFPTIKEALVIAIKEGFVDLVVLFLETIKRHVKLYNKGYVEFDHIINTNIDYDAPLFHAVECNQLKIVELLLESGVKINIGLKDNDTP